MYHYRKTLINFSNRTIKSSLRIGPAGKISFVTLAPKKCNFTLDFQRSSVVPVMYLGSVFGFNVNYSFAFEKSIGLLKIFRDLISAAVSSILVHLQWLKFCSHLFLNIFSIFIFLQIEQKHLNCLNYCKNWIKDSRMYKSLENQSQV